MLSTSSIPLSSELPSTRLASTRATSLPSSPTGSLGRDPINYRIPRPPNAFITFRNAFFKSLALPSTIEECRKHLSKLVGTMWKDLPPTERVKWDTRAKVAFEEHRRMYPDDGGRNSRVRNKNPAMQNNVQITRTQDNVRHKYSENGRGEHATNHRTSYDFNNNSAFFNTGGGHANSFNGSNVHFGSNYNQDLRGPLFGLGGAVVAHGVITSAATIYASRTSTAATTAPTIASGGHSSSPPITGIGDNAAMAVALPDTSSCICQTPTLELELTPPPNDPTNNSTTNINANFSDHHPPLLKDNIANVYTPVMLFQKNLKFSVTLTMFLTSLNILASPF